MAVNLVFMVPGFLGYENIREYSYFAERVSTALRAILSERTGKGVEVVAVPIPPTGSLADRQYALARTLAQRTAVIRASTGQDVVIHLVGHSTGGVDAQLLTMEQALAGRSWDDFDGENIEIVRARIKSVISLASPHQGTCFATDPIAQWFASDSVAAFFELAPAATLRALPGLKRIVSQSLRIVRDPDLRDLLRNALGSRDAWSFTRSVMRSRDLVTDLTPAESVGRYERLKPISNILRRSFVTVAASSPTDGQDILAVHKRSAPLVDALNRRKHKDAEQPATKADALFSLLLDLTSGRTTGCDIDAPLLANSVEAVNKVAADPRLVIAAPGSLVPSPIGRSASDGVVNTVRQMINPADPDEIQGVVVADHFDVIGYYDRELFGADPKTGKPMRITQVAGILHSGSQFRDGQFFLLMRRIADAMQPALAK